MTKEILLAIAATWLIQDSVASLWHYWGKEGISNQAFRWARLGFGIMVLVGVFLYR